MAKHILSIICVLTNIISLISFSNSISSCTNNGPCQTLNDGDGQLIFFFSSSVESDNQLICINGKCNNDPNLGTHICEEPIPEDGLPCNGTCKTLDDCEGQLICINGKCDDDPDIGTNRCGGASSPPPPPDPSVCDGPCRTLDDCDGQLICINGKCDDDPDIGTHRCDGVSSPPPPIGSCLQHGEVKCQGNSYPTYNCSSQVTSSTLANLTLKNFESRTSGSSKCEERSHSNNETIVALSTGWYAGGIRCGKMIQINGKNGRTVSAKVVDECDSMNTCEPCKNDIIDGSKAVWDALGLNTDVGEVSVTWSMG